MCDFAALGDTPMSKTNTAPKARPEKKNLFGLSPNQLKMVVGGSGVISNGTGVAER
jgi:hypothetical protein